MDGIGAISTKRNYDRPAVIKCTNLWRRNSSSNNNNTIFIQSPNKYMYTSSYTCIKSCTDLIASNDYSAINVCCIIYLCMVFCSWKNVNVCRHIKAQNRKKLFTIMRCTHDQFAYEEASVHYAHTRIHTQTHTMDESI